MPADRDRMEEDSDSSTSSAAPVSKKSKSWGKLKTFLFFILLIAGAVTGIHHSGAVDVRPFMWNVAPKIPFIGDYLKENLNIPEIYTLTVAERRKLELQQWQERLDVKERELEAKLAQSESLSNDIAARQQRIDRQEASLSARESDLTKKSEATPEEEALMKELVSTYQEMSSRNAAQIMAQLPDHLAVEVIKKLPQDARASILSKMPAKRAAQITENLVNPQ